MRTDRLANRFEQTSPLEVWAKVKKQLDQMSDEQRGDTLKQAGILTPKGRVAKPYRQVIRLKSASRNS